MQISTVSPRFGWSAGADDVKAIQTAAKNTWKLTSVDAGLCFSQTESGFGLWDTVKNFFGNLWDGFMLRYRMFRKGYGLFAKHIPEPSDVFRLYRYPSAERAQDALKGFKQTETQLRTFKNTVIKKAAEYRQYLQQAKAAIEKADTSSFAVPSGWLNPFPTMQPFKVSGTKSTNGKQPWIQENYISTTQVAQVDDKTLLVRIRLGPHA